jgi:hypothetical protein
MPSGLYVLIIFARYSRFEALTLDLSSKGKAFVGEVASVGRLAYTISYSGIV